VLAHLLFELWHLPSERIVVEHSVSGRELMAAVTHGRGRWRRSRPILAVLPIPRESDQYLRGRPRHALRTHLRKATALSLVFREVRDRGEWVRLCEEVLDARGPVAERVEGRPVDWFLRHRTDRCFAVVGPDARCRAIAAAIVTPGDAYLRVLISATGEDGAGTARYLLHTGLVRVLSDEGVRRVWTDGPLTVPPGLQHFQRILGYTCVRPRVRRTTPGKRAAVLIADEDVGSRRRSGAGLIEPLRAGRRSRLSPAVHSQDQGCGSS
jgi:hypothetical protein